MTNKPKIHYMSYSQSSDLKDGECLLKWKLRRIDEIKINKPNIFSVFGSAIHKTCQDWIKLMYKKNKSIAMKEDLFKNFQNKLFDIYVKEKTEYGINFLTLDEIKELIEDSKEILKDFKKKWFEYFPYSDFELYGIERKLNILIYDDIKNMRFFGLVDVIMKNKETDEYYIIDLKTSYRGWNNKKKLESKDQVLYYKKYYAKQYNIPEEKIIPMYIILKRKMFAPDDSSFKISHVSKYMPPHKRALDKSIDNFKRKIEKVFLIENNKMIINIDINYVANPSKDNCKFCPYKNTEYCKEGK